MRRPILLFLCCIFIIQSYSQDKATNLKHINETWTKFQKAFETLDHTYMEDIHSKDLVRVSGGKRILDYNTYMSNYKQQFERNKGLDITQQIELRFFERLNNETTASERGIYKLTIHRGNGKTGAYYGQFHVLFKKIDGKWLITMDYDSNENNAIGEAEFLKSYPLDDIKHFLD